MFEITNETATTMVRLNCGAFDFVPGHGIEVGDWVSCPDGRECPGALLDHDESQVADVLRTHTADLSAPLYANAARQLGSL